MMTTTMGRLVSAVCFALAVAALVLLVVAWTGFHHGGRGRVELSSSARLELENLAAKNQTVIESMPGHPRSREVLEDVLAVLRYEFGVDDRMAVQLATELFRDSKLGLYALDAYLQDESSSPAAEEAETPLAYAERLCETYPNSKVGAMAFDYLLGMAADKHALCASLRQAAPSSRLAAFVLVREGDTYADEGADAQAILCYMDAWKEDAKRAKMLRPRVARILENHGFWHYPMLIPDAYVEASFVLPALGYLRESIRRTLPNDALSIDAASRVWETSTVSDSLQEIARDESHPLEMRTDAACRVLKMLLESAQFEDATAVLDSLYQTLSSPSESAEYTAMMATAVFLFPISATSAMTADQGNDPIAALDAQQKAIAAQSRFLSLLESRMSQAPPDTGALLAMLVSSRQMQLLSVAQAVKTLEDALDIQEVSHSLRKDISLELARIYSEEWGSLDKAAETCASYCSSLPEDESSSEMRYMAGRYFFESDDYASARKQFELLGTEAATDNDKSLAQYMVALCRLQNDEGEAAVRALQTFVDTWPNHSLSDRALYLVATSQLGKLEYAKARDSFLELTRRYPNSEFTKRSEEYIGKLEGLGAL